MEYIIELVRKTIEKYNTRNPFEICREAGIGVKFKDIGNLKGFYSVINKRTYIVINDSISEKEAELVCAHELGHHLLHDYLADNPVIREISFYDPQTRPELEANVFAAELLIADDEMLELVNSDYTLKQIAAILGYDLNIVKIKLKYMGINGAYKSDM